MAKNNRWLILILLFATRFSAAQSRDTGLNNKKRIAVQKTYTIQIGTRELTGNNDGKAVETYLKYTGLSKGNPWCAAFVCWVLGQNSVKNPKNAYSPALFNAANTIYKRDSKHNTIPPLTADVFGIYFPEKGRIAHVGFIDKWGSETVVTVEGNTNQAGSREGDGVYKKIRLTRQIYAIARYVK